MSEELLSYDEAARILRISESTLRKWTAARKIAFVRVGGRVRFRHKELDDYINSPQKKGDEAASLHPPFYYSPL